MKLLASCVEKCQNKIKNIFLNMEFHCTQCACERVTALFGLPYSYPATVLCCCTTVVLHCGQSSSGHITMALLDGLFGSDAGGEASKSGSATSEPAATTGAAGGGKRTTQKNTTHRRGVIVRLHFCS